MHASSDLHDKSVASMSLTLTTCDGSAAMEQQVPVSPLKRRVKVTLTPKELNYSQRGSLGWTNDLSTWSFIWQLFLSIVWGGSHGEYRYLGSWSTCALNPHRLWWLPVQSSNGKIAKRRRGWYSSHEPYEIGWSTWRPSSSSCNEGFDSPANAEASWGRLKRTRYLPGWQRLGATDSWGRRILWYSASTGQLRLHTNDRTALRDVEVLRYRWEQSKSSTNGNCSSLWPATALSSQVVPQEPLLHFSGYGLPITMKRNWHWYNPKLWPAAYFLTFWKFWWWWGLRRMDQSEARAAIVFIPIVVSVHIVEASRSINI